MERFRQLQFILWITYAVYEGSSLLSDVACRQLQQLDHACYNPCVHLCPGYQTTRLRLNATATTTTALTQPTTTTTTTQKTSTRTTLCPTTVNMSNVLHTYVGCYGVFWLCLLPNDCMYDKHQSTDTCKRHCHTKKHTYFGMKGTLCFCGDVIKDKYTKRPETDCNSPCPGDKSTMCGGIGRISSYKIV